MTGSVPGKSSSAIGIIEWFRPGEYTRVEHVLADLRSLDVGDLRTGFSWADWHAPEGVEWYDWLIPRLAAEVTILPCFVYTPPSLGIAPKASSPPREPKAYADFLDQIMTRLGEHFEWLELWTEPNNRNNWDGYLDPAWQIFCEMVGGAAYWAQQRGKKTVLGGTCPTDLNWLDLMCQRGVMRYIDAVGVHGFPGTWEFDWKGWPETIAKVQEVLRRRGLNPAIWITEAGYSTWRHDEHQQLCEFAKFMEAPVHRAYWYSAHDLHRDLRHQDGFHRDERHYHFGLKHDTGKAKLLLRVWRDKGVEGVRALAELRSLVEVNGSRQPTRNGGPVRGVAGSGLAPLRSVPKRQRRRVLITGGAGFVGTNLAQRLLAAGKSVLIFDNLSRPGVEQNVRWLCERYGERVQVALSDVRDPYGLRDAVQQVEQVFHLAAQVAVTTSLADPRDDFEVNLQGTLHLLEALRALKRRPPLVYTSTNKVYGALQDIALRQNTTRFEPVDQSVRRYGISEERPLQFHSPYGCSKGAADQYVLDYARAYGLPAVVFRMSCIYGPHQFGTEDQGWVAHFLIRALQRKSLTLFGNGMQVRDILFVRDLVEALLLAQEHIDSLAGQAFNIGGGVSNAVSLIEVIDLIGELHGDKPALRRAAWRLGDQKYYVSDTRKFAKATGWSAQVSVQEGVQKLYRWLRRARAASAA